MSETGTENTPKAYRRPKEPTNFITYAVAALLAFVGFALLLSCSLINASPSLGRYAVFLFAAVVFTVGALCHILPATSRAGEVCRKLDRCAVPVLIAGAFFPVMFSAFGAGTSTDAIWGYTLFAIIAVATVCVAAVSVANVAEYKIICLVFYVVIGWACVARAHRIVDLCGWGSFWALFGGCAAYFTGAIVGALEGMPARHAFKHILVIVGAAAHCAGIYLFLMYV